MESLFQITTTLALIGAGTIGGVFFAFSNFVMKALERLPSLQGIAAMQSINVIVINPGFLGIFIGTAILSLGSVVVAYTQWGTTPSAYLLGGSICYLVGTLLVTVAGNIPLNDRLAILDATESDADVEWRNFVERWCRLNHIRSVAALVAALLFCMALVKTVGA
ncbi:MAG: putative membrane protein [Planctomycetota bacterium]|jgi:uncharacterized membrane protein